MTNALTNALAAAETLMGQPCRVKLNGTRYTVALDGTVSGADGPVTDELTARVQAEAERLLPWFVFQKEATRLATLNGWSAPNGLFLAGDLDGFWRLAKRRNPSNPVAALRQLKCWKRVN